MSVNPKYLVKVAEELVKALRDLVESVTLLEQTVAKLVKGKKDKE